MYLHLPLASLLLGLVVFCLGRLLLASSLLRRLLCSRLMQSCLLVSYLGGLVSWPIC